VWKTTDGGQTWTPLTDFQASLAIGAVAIDPNNSSTIYAGTGEDNYSVDSYYGQGLLKSTDAGNTWTLIRAPFTNSDTAPSFAQIAVQPGNSNIVLAATQDGATQDGGGIYRSSDGGQTWSNVLSSFDTDSVMFDVKNSNIAYAAGAGYSISNTNAVFYKSLDAGQTWAPADGTGTNVLPAANTVARMAITEDASGKTLYAAVALDNSNDNGSGNPGSIYKSIDGGANWTNLGPPSASDGPDWYRDAIAVDPANTNVIYTTGINLYRSTDGGKTWTGYGFGSPGLYSDQHAIVFSANGSQMYVADDGGIFVTNDPADTSPSFSSLNETLNTMTFYPGFSISPNDEAQLLAGSQDHGLDLYQGYAMWGEVGLCGDGGAAYIDSEGSYAYGHCPGANTWIANSSGVTSMTNWQLADTGINPNNTDDQPWVADIKGDWQTVATVYTGTNYLYQSTDSAYSWMRISPDITQAGGPGIAWVINTIAVSPSDSNTVYVGTGNGMISVTHNALSGADATWTSLSGLPTRWINKILVGADSANDVYITLNGFDSGHIFHSTNGGATWTDISGNLPNTPVDSIIVDPDVQNTIYLATDTGVYFTENGGASWGLLGTGLPNVVVQDILMYEPTRTLHVITHGRGAWETIVPLVGLQASAADLQFGNQAMNATSSTQTVTLTNNQQSASLNLTGFNVTGPFAQTNNCGSALAAGSTCTVSVTFTPDVEGTLQGRLTVSSSTNQVVVILYGTGTAAITTTSLTASATSAAYGASVTLTTTVMSGSIPMKKAQ
jgi:photosystem II stability/assembly factor-like uncharacterized protein